MGEMNSKNSDEKIEESEEKSGDAETADTEMQVTMVTGRTAAPLRHLSEVGNGADCIGFHPHEAENRPSTASLLASTSYLW